MAASLASAGTFKLTDGKSVSGKPLASSGNDDGILFTLDDGSISPRVPWDKFTPDALKELAAEDTSAHDKVFIDPLAENLPQAAAKRMEIVVTPITPPPRPTRASGVFGLFGSPVGIVILLVLYGTNIFAAYEVALFRHQPVATVCGLAAIPVFGVASPIIFISMATRPAEVEPGAPEDSKAAARIAADGTAAAEAGAPGEQASAYAPEASAYESGSEPPPPASNLPEPIVFPKSEFSFNRRFFETKFAGFFRIIPAESEKDLVLLVKSNRGDYVGRRITRVTPAELYLQIFNNNATADEMIPFGEIVEVQIRHKDTV